MNNELDLRRKELGRHLRDYLERQGVKVTGQNSMSCFLGRHKDQNPSMVLMKPDYDRCFCWACGGSMDIFTAANHFEGKPLNGKSFIVDNVNYLSRMFGYQPMELELSERDEQTLVSERVHRIATGLFRKKLNIEMAVKRGWMNEQECRRLGVGTIANTSEFIQDLMKLAKVSREELEQSGLDVRMFAPHMLTFVLEDDHGNCIGFASRNMNFEAEKAKNPEYRGQRFLKPPSHAPLYDNSKFLYNLHRAKKSPRVVLVEGFADPITGETHGVFGLAGYGAALTFNEEKVETLIRNGVTRVVLGGDFDFGKINPADGKPVRVGQEGTMRALDILSKYPQMRVRVIDYESVEKEIREKAPELYSIDLDKAILILGPDKVNELIDNAIPTVEFAARELQHSGVTDKRELAEKLVDIVSREHDPLEIQDQLKVVVKHTDFDYDLLMEAVKLKRDVFAKEHKIKVEEIIADFNKKLYRARDVLEIIDLSHKAFDQIDDLDPRKVQTTIEQELRWVEAAEARSRGEIGNAFYPTGVHFFDQDMGGSLDEKSGKWELGGIPDVPAYILFPGYPGAGKSMAVQAIIHGCLKRNPNLDFIVMAPDDGKEGWLRRLWCLESNLKMFECMFPKKYLQGPHCKDDWARLNQAQEAVKEWIMSRHLVLRDSSDGTGIHALRKMVEEHYKRTDRKAIVVLDGIHKLSGVSEQGILEDYSTKIRQMTQEFKTTFFVTAELRKRQNEVGVSRYEPPTAEEIKGTKQIEHDADAIYLMDNPVRRMREPKNIGAENTSKKQYSFWDFKNTCWIGGDPSHAQLNDGETKFNIRPNPVLWIHREKNKIFDIDGDAKLYHSIFYPPKMQFTDPGRKIAGSMPDSING